MTEMQMDSFLTVAETLNFSRAAEQLSISQPTLSKHIKLLEEDLGFTLLERTRSAVALTPEGALMYDTLKRVREQVRDSVTRARSGNVGGRRKVGIAVMRGLSVSRLPALRDAIAAYTAEEPDNEVALFRGDMPDLWQMMKTGDADMVVAPDYVSTGGRILDSVLLCHSKALLFSGSLAELKTERGELDLAACSLITIGPEGDMDYFDYFTQLMEARGIDMGSVAMQDSQSGMMNAAAAGLGAALYFDVSGMRNDPTLHWREVPEAGVGIRGFFGLRSGAFLRFLDCLRRCAGEA